MRSSDHLSAPHVKPTHPPPLIRLPLQRLSHDPRILVSLRIHIAILQCLIKGLVQLIHIIMQFLRGDNANLLTRPDEQVPISPCPSLRIRWVDWDDLAHDLFPLYARMVALHLEIVHIPPSHQTIAIALYPLQAAFCVTEYYPRSLRSH